MKPKDRKRDFNKTFQRLRPAKMRKMERISDPEIFLQLIKDKIKNYLTQAKNRMGIASFCRTLQRHRNNLNSPIL
jgi:hypothetical protein